jgi:hypothetical protein
MECQVGEMSWHREIPCSMNHLKLSQLHSNCKNFRQFFCRKMTFWKKVKLLSLKWCSDNSSNDSWLSDNWPKRLGVQWLWEVVGVCAIMTSVAIFETFFPFLCCGQWNGASFIREVSLNGKAKYSWPGTNQLGSAAFLLKILCLFFYKTRYLNEEVNHTLISPQLVFPASLKESLTYKGQLQKYSYYKDYFCLNFSVAFKNTFLFIKKTFCCK